MFNARKYDSMKLVRKKMEKNSRLGRFGVSGGIRMNAMNMKKMTKKISMSMETKRIRPTPVTVMSVWIPASCETAWHISGWNKLAMGTGFEAHT